MKYLSLLMMMSFSAFASVPQELLSIRNQALESLKSYHATDIPAVATETAYATPKVKRLSLNEDALEIHTGAKLIEQATSTQDEEDSTLSEESEDLQEGVTELAALSGSAAAAQNNFSSIFAGSKQECERFIWGSRDCCQGNGFLEGLIHCPRELQALQRAKLEGRTVYLGSYKNNPFAAMRYVYCVFPTKLAGILQIQGRFNQLHVSFGSAKKANCRGITTEELAQINFKQLDLSSLTEETLGRMQIPEGSYLQQSNQTHIEELARRSV